MPKFLYDRRGPWPQPSPQRPFGLAPGVLHVPMVERVAWWFGVGFRIGAQIAYMTPVAAIQSLLHRVRDFVDEPTFQRLMTSSCYQKFFATLDPPDQADFAAYITDPSAQYFKSEFTAITNVKPYKGMYIAPTTSLIRFKNNQLEVLAVRVTDVTKNPPVTLVVDPTHTNTWNLTKFFVLQGAAYSMLFTEHPNLHFPFDSINAVTKTSVPTDHLIYKLLKPHLAYELELDREVLQSRTTVITNWRPTIYAPFTADLKDGLLDFFTAGYSGVPGNSAYPKYSFRLQPKPILADGDYGKFLNRYYDTILDFTKKVAAKIPAGDEYTSHWANYNSQWIAGFPPAPQIFQGDTLAEVLAGIMWDMSVGHAVDHNAFSFDVTPEQKFLRIHLKPPDSLTMQPANPKKVATWWDGLKLRIAHKVFFETHTITKLATTRYHFGDPQLDQANQDFLDALKQTEINLPPIQNYIPLHMISASIQY